MSTEKITQDWQVLTPAYGRDYKNSWDARTDFRKGVDFVLNSPGGGSTYCSIRDFAPGVRVNIRYKKITQVCAVTV